MKNPNISAEANALAKECMEYWIDKIPPEQFKEMHYVGWLLEQLVITRKRLDQLEKKVQS